MPASPRATSTTTTPSQPSLPPGTPPPATDGHGDEAEATSSSSKDEPDDDEQNDDDDDNDAQDADVKSEHEQTQPPLPDEPVPPAASTGVHKGRDPNWTAVWDPPMQAYYFHNTVTGVTQWTNPFDQDPQQQPQPQQPVASTSSAVTDANEVEDGRPKVDYGGIDPDLAFLDPNLARKQTLGTAAPTFQAKFNAKTGRFQGDPSMNPDRISDFSRASRQQEAYYNTSAWTESLQGRGLYRGAPEEDDEQGAAGRKRKPSSKQVQAFKDKKEQRKKAKLMSFFKS